jgi:hypothetical protein
VLVGILLLMTGGLFAQTPQELRLDTQVPGIIIEGESNWYRVRASQLGFVVVETSGYYGIWVIFDSSAFQG